MSASPATPDQKNHLNRITAQAVKAFIRDAKPTLEDLQILFAQNGQFAKEIATLLKRLTKEFPESARARSILGGDFITPQEIMSANPKIVYSLEQVAKLIRTIPSTDILSWCKRYKYALLPGPPEALSVLGVRSLKPEHFYSRVDGWFAEPNEKFATWDKVFPGWLLIRKGLVPNSTGIDWLKQRQLVTKPEYIPNVAEVAWLVSIFRLVHGVRLFKNSFARTSSVASSKCNVFVTSFAEGDSLGMSVTDYTQIDDMPMGIVSARKLLM